jgi:P27 family predicted phage terminase small subunit
MAKPGRKKTPTPILKLRGSWRAKLRKDIEVVGFPLAPEGLGDKARAHWADIVPKLAEIGLLADFDWPKLAGMCEIYEQMQMIKPISKLPERKSVHGKLEANPHFYAMLKLRALYDRLSSQFGMAPANRAGMGGAQKTRNDNSKARFFQKGREGA